MNTATGETNGQKKGQEREELDKKAGKNNNRIITRLLLSPRGIPKGEADQKRISHG